MAFPCAPRIPPLPGIPLFIPQAPLPRPVLPWDIGGGDFVTPPPPPPIQFPVPAVEEPRRPSEFPLGNLYVLYWLATLTRASYSPTPAFMQRAVRAVLPVGDQITFVPNGAGLTPGYTVIKLPLGAIVVVSGTTNLGQWMQQIFNGGMQEWVGPPPGNEIMKMGSQPVYISAANALITALTPLVPNDQQILFVGHSMGGAVAQLLHAVQGLRGAPRSPSRCCTFAAPKMGDNRAKYAARIGQQVFRAYIIDTDFVPSLPPDLGVLQLAVPEAFRAQSASWASFKRPNGLYAVNERGESDTIEEPFFPIQVGLALVAAAAGAPVQFLAAHAPATFVARFYDAITRQGTAVPQGWNDANALLEVNRDLTAAGL